MLRASGLQNSAASDIYADTRAPNGNLLLDDWPLLFHFEGNSRDVTITRAIVKNPVVRTNTSYDNGDCFATESLTERITFTDVRCFEAFDAAFDLKGKDHAITNAVAWKIGNRAFRIWDGPVTIRNAIAGFDGQGSLTQTARGSNAAIWTQGNVTVLLPGVDLAPMLV